MHVQIQLPNMTPEVWKTFLRGQGPYKPIFTFMAPEAASSRLLTWIWHVRLCQRRCGTLYNTCLIKRLSYYRHCFQCIVVIPTVDNGAGSGITYERPPTNHTVNKCLKGTTVRAHLPSVLVFMQYTSSSANIL